tara:strand:+ start:510 stop:644 length:135 start_codon:yes stop_codon:yes gene_type:complete
MGRTNIVFTSVSEDYYNDFLLHYKLVREFFFFAGYYLIPIILGL